MRALFLVNGLGLGNSTRCHAVIQRLVERGAEVAVITGDNGAWYMRERTELAAFHEMESVWYAKKNGRLDVLGTVGAVGQFVAIARRNDARVKSVIADFKPDVAVIDSVYTVCSLKSAKVPIAAVNNADVVHVAWQRFTERPSSVRAQFYTIEENDYRFHRMVPDLVVSPNIDPTLPTVGAPYVRVGPIVRAGFTPTEPEPTPRVVVMLSGSTFGTPVDLRGGHGLHIDVLGRPVPTDGRTPDGVAYHGKVRDTLPFLRGASLAVVNGGFSAVSEIFAMRMPMVVVPVPNHAEQWLNAKVVESLGIGVISTEEGLEDAMMRAMDRLPQMRAAYDRLPQEPDGATSAAEAIAALGKG